MRPAPLGGSFHPELYVTDFTLKARPARIRLSCRTIATRHGAVAVSLIPGRLFDQARAKSAIRRRRHAS